MVERGKRKDRNGTSNNCRRRYLVTVEEDYQEEARKEKEGEEGEGSEQKKKGLKGKTPYKR